MQVLNDERRGHAAVREGHGQSRAEIDHLNEQLREMRASVGAAQQELQAKDAKLHAKELELQESQLQSQRNEKETETVKTQQREQMAQIYKEQVEKEQCLRKDLEFVKNAAAKSERRYLDSERIARKARWEADTALEERKWIEQELKKKQSRCSPFGVLALELTLAQPVRT